MQAKTTVDSSLPKRQVLSKTFVQLFRRYGIGMILIGIIILMSILSPAFLDVGNLMNVIKQVSVIGIIAVGVTIVIITTGIDLSSGSVIAFVSVVAASFGHPGTPLIVSLAIGLSLGALAGFINGTLITKGNIPPFIVTLGMMTAARGAALLYSDGRPIGDLSPSFQFIGSGTLLGIPVPIVLFAFVAIVSHLLLSKTKYGKYTYAIGGNEHAAIICGVNVNRMKLIIYTYAGLLSGLAGIILTARVSSGQPSAGMAYELDAIAAAVIGGTSLAGGIGTIGGTVIGALIIGVLNNGLDLLNVSSYWQQILKGAIIVTAIYFDSKKNR
jgi:inositol transport system permease protein